MESVKTSENIDGGLSCPEKTQPFQKTLIFGSQHIKHLLLDISAHICPKRFTKELQYVFPNTDISNVIAIPTMQFAKNDLVNIGDVIEVEKDRLLEKFMAIAKLLCDEFIQEGHWADYIDPCSGLPMLHQDGNKVFSEVDSAEQLLGYSVMNAGCCKVLLHPQWGSAVYPATLFTTAPVAIVVQKLNSLKEGIYDDRLDY